MSLIANLRHVKRTGIATAPHQHGMSVTTVQPPDTALGRFHKLLQKKERAVAGLPTSISQTFLATASSLRNEVVLWLAHSPQERDQLVALMQFWQRHHLESRDQQIGVSTHTSAGQHPEYRRRIGEQQQPTLVPIANEAIGAKTFPTTLLSLKEGANVWFVCTPDDVLLPMPSPELLRKQIVEITIGRNIAPAVIGQNLGELGYEQATMVTEPGTFARRGSIVDVWPMTTGDPIRIDLLDQKIESMTFFNWKTQRNRENLESVALPPCSLPKANRSTLIEYLAEIRQRVHVLSPEAEELETLDPDAHTALERLKGFHHLTFLPFADNGSMFDVQSAPLFHRDFDLLNKFVSNHASWMIIIASSRAYEINERLGKERNRKVLEISKTEVELLRGFISERDKVVFLTDWEVYGQQRETGERRSERADIIFVAEMKPGDFVVHIDHGIGRFVGMTEQDMSGQKREYFVLSYAEDDKLFVPVEMADKLSKYIGVANPKLHRLSGSNWAQMTKKIKEETKATAEELLKLYAERETVKTSAFGPQTLEEHDLAESFPYETTPDQKKAIVDIEHDLRQTRPMDRLICGDVGFGKTEVAIRAAFKAVINKKQVAILSPTTILTQQHYDTFRERLAKFDISIDVLSRFRSPKQLEETIAKLRLGQVSIIIGTHRLLQSDVHFRDLGLVIIDEEQRFGVEDKEKLKTLRLSSHVLTLTATPIPRTLNFALAGIRDVTVIETPPEGRKPIETHIEAYHDATVHRALERELKRGGQVYFVYNNVETIALRARELKELVPGATFGIAHGQMPEEELVRAMADFDQKKIDVLVCSTIIENGLDLPNVNTLIVDHATQFGLAQLYQLRGRIGRGQNQAYSYFLYHAKKLTPEARKRLQALLEARELGSGFQLALRDLEIRGTGSILGKKQHGHVSAVGLSLYSRLLAETIRELRDGRRAEPQREILIDLPMTIRIPKDMEPNEQKRLSYYQKLALESTTESLEQRAFRLFRRKVLPEPVQNLVNVLKLKILAQPVNVTSIAARKGISSDIGLRLVITFSESLIPAQIKALIDDNGEWQFGENSIKISQNALGENWMEKLQKTMMVLEKSKHLVVNPEHAKSKVAA